MSKADKMFKELGYEIDSTYEIKGHLYYCKDNIKIDFDLKRQNFYKYSTTGCRCPVSIQELQAIYEKVKELGWNE